MKVSAGGGAAACRVVFCGARAEGADPQLQRLAASGRFRPEQGQVKVLETGGGPLIAVGVPEGESIRRVQQQIGRAVRLACQEGIEEAELDLDSWPGALPGEQLVRAAALAAWEGSYTFSRYLARPGLAVKQIYLKRTGLETPALARALEEGDRLGRAVAAVRDVVNRTSRDLTPQAMAEWILERARGGGYEAELLDEAALRTAGAQALLSVSAGAACPPVMAVLRYRGDPERPEHVTAVLGKGITYDSGGLSLKSKTGMITMHHDMAGAAAAAAALDAAARQGLPINLTAVLPLCENMLAPAGYRPGDVIGTMDGRTVLIRSTDAEGRLVLADAITWAIRREGAKRLVDIATLTGGAVAAFGPLINAAAVEDPELRAAVQAASRTSGELVWEMPLLSDYRSQLQTDHADIANSSGSAGPKMIHAALFLKEFTQSLPWLHIDSAGTSWTEKTDGVSCYGATGAGTVLLFDLFRRLAERTDGARCAAEGPAACTPEAQ